MSQQDDPAVLAMRQADQMDMLQAELLRCRQRGQALAQLQNALCREAQVLSDTVNETVDRILDQLPGAIFYPGQNDALRSLFAAQREHPAAWDDTLCSAIDALRQEWSDCEEKADFFEGELRRMEDSGGL